mmetsp:Transcript_8727/g.12046  ORF Transcript_8727/g.12046 Transcript_8727/m.12046 type:complete len:267 (-) Transcript_8727:794-1594(-)
MQPQQVPFGENSFSVDEKEEIRALLNKKLNKDELSYRAGPGGQKLAYIETWKAIEMANEIFGYNGWSSSVINLSQDYIEEENGKVQCGVSAVVRIQLKDGTYHEDVGYGSAENQKSKAAALEKAKKEAVSDALKRALRLFGNHLGNSVYDKEHLKNVKNEQQARPAMPPPLVQQQNPLPQGTQNPNMMKPPMPQNYPPNSQIPVQNGFGSGNPGVPAIPNQMNQPPNFYPANPQNRPTQMIPSQIPNQMPNQLPTAMPQNQPQRKF